MKLGKKDNKPEEEEVETPVNPEELSAVLFGPEDLGVRTIGLCGDVEEEKVGEVIGMLLGMRQSGLFLPGNSPSEDPVEFLISTSGGSAHEMFALYDVMRLMRNDMPIHTIGIGKVMSAGVVLLAAGTKGQRKITKNCRVMLHSVIGGNMGSLHSLENEMDEIRCTQERYIDALVQETDMTKRFLKKLIERKVNVYLTAQEAVEYGIADEVV